MLFRSAQELKFHLGFIDAGITFANLRTDIELASSALRRQIGSEIYNAAQAFYDTHWESYQNPPEEATPWDRAMGELVMRIQLPIALNAYLAFAPNNDLTHDASKGRQIMVGESEKPAFEWQIERDENALRNREQRAMEELLRWLEENTQEVYTIPSPYPESITLKAGQYFRYDHSNWVLYNRYYYSGSASITDMYELLDSNAIQFCYFDPNLPTAYENKSYGQWVAVEYDGKYYRSLMPGIETPPDPGVFSDGDLWGELIMYPAYIPEYKSSAAWKENNRLLVNTAEMFDEIFPIEKSYRLFSILRPFVRRAEEQQIIPIVGKELFAGLLERRRTGILTEDDTLLMGYITPAVVMTAMSRAVRSLSATLLPDGLLKQFARNTNATRSANDYMQRNQIALVFDEMAASDLQALQGEMLRRQAPEAVEDNTDPLNNDPSNIHFRV